MLKRSAYQQWFWLQARGGRGVCLVQVRSNAMLERPDIISCGSALHAVLLQYGQHAAAEDLHAESLAQAAAIALKKPAIQERVYL
jgi:hypothetical protein